MIRSLICVTAVSLAFVVPSLGQQRQAARGNTGGNALEIGKAGAWGIFTAGEGRAKTCFIMAQPAERLPKGLSRDPAHVYVSMRQGDAARQEFAVITGYPVKQGADAQVAVGAVSFVGTGQNKNIWLKNPAEEGRFIGELRKGSSLSVKGTSQKGNDTTDRYPLTGFGQALERAQKECS
jgi:hypothetical protein